MSANRDRDLKTTFVFNNLYEIYKRGQKPESKPTGLQHGQVIKAEDVNNVNSNMMGLVTVRQFKPASFMGKQLEARANAAAVAPAPAAAPSEAGAPRRIETKSIVKSITTPAQLPVADRAPATAPANPVIDGLKKNLTELQELHGRLRFMLTELEDLVRDKK